MSINTITTIAVDAARVDGFLELVRSGAATTRDAPGCVSFTFLVNGERSNEVVFLEEWQNADAQEAYVAGRIADGSMEELASFFAAPPETKVLREVS